MLHAGLQELVKQEVIHPVAALVVRWHNLSALQLPHELRAFFVTQVVGRYVLRAGAYGLLYVRPPLADALSVDAVDEVDADVAESGCLCHADGLTGCLCIMSSAEGVEHAVVKRLYAETEPVDACRAPSVQFLRVNVARVGFDADFGVFADLKAAVYAVGQQRYLSFVKQAWRAAPEVDGLQRMAGQVVGAHLQFVKQASDESVAFSQCGRRVEGAVGTTTLAYRDMDV